MPVKHRINKGHNLGNGWIYAGPSQARGEEGEHAHIVENPSLPKETRQRRVIFTPQPAAGEGAYEVSFIGVPHQVASKFLNASGVEETQRTNVTPRAIKVSHVIPEEVGDELKKIVDQKVPRPLPPDLNLENRDQIGHKLRSSVFRAMERAGVIAPEERMRKTYSTFSQSLSMAPEERLEHLKKHKVTPDDLRNMQEWVLKHYSPAFRHTVTSRKEGMDFWVPVEKMHDGFTRAELDAYRMEKEGTNRRSRS